MRQTLLLLIFIFVSQFAFSQVIGGKLEKLEKLYVSGKIENCLFKADGYLYKEETSKDPEPYLYIAICLYELSQSEDADVQADYKDGIKQSVKAAIKFIKKDKTGEMYNDNIDFVNTLKAEQFKKVQAAIKSNKNSKIATAAKTYDRLNRTKDYSILYFVGVNEVLARNYSQGKRNIDIATEKMTEQLKSGGIKFDSRFKPLISKSFASYSENLISNNELEQALECTEFGLKVFPNDGFLKVHRNMINKAIEQKAKELEDQEKK